MSVASPLGTVGVLVRYWVKGRFTKATILGLVIGEAFSVVFILFGSSTYLSFSNRVGLTTGLSEVAGSLVLALYLVGLIQSGFNGGGLPVSSSDVDYVFTSPVPPREVYSANSRDSRRDCGCHQGSAERARRNCQCRSCQRDPGRARLYPRSSVAVCL